MGHKHWRDQRGQRTIGILREIQDLIKEKKASQTHTVLIALAEVKICMKLGQMTARNAGMPGSGMPLCHTLASPNQ